MAAFRHFTWHVGEMVLAMLVLLWLSLMAMLPQRQIRVQDQAPRPM